MVLQNNIPSFKRNIFIEMIDPSWIQPITVSKSDIININCYFPILKWIFRRIKTNISGSKKDSYKIMSINESALNLNYNYNKTYVLPSLVRSGWQSDYRHSHEFGNYFAFHRIEDLLPRNDAQLFDGIINFWFIFFDSLSVLYWSILSILILKNSIFFKCS